MLLAFCHIVKAQPPTYTPNFPVDTNLSKISFSEVVEVPGVSKDKIYYRAKDWFTRQFNIAQAFVSMADKERGKLIGHATIFRPMTGLFNFPYSINCNIYITVKEGKYKYTITDFTLVSGLDEDKLPIYKSANDFINDPKHVPGKDDYPRSVKFNLKYIEQYANFVAPSLKDALSSTRLDYKNLEDDF